MPDYPPFGSLNPQAPPDTDAMGSIYGVQPPQSSVQWLRQYLPQSVGDFLSNREAQALAPTNAREIAGDVISTAGNIMPAGRFGVPRGGGIRAFHGSPYDFDRFDISKIGTGEGAQAYGHGLYFAENPAVAQSYENVNIAGLSQIKKMAQQHLDAAGGDTAAAISSYNDIVRRANVPPEVADVVRRTIEAGRPGRMYEVSINASPEQFLDWDRPIGQQAPEIRSALSRFNLPPDRQGVGVLSKIGMQANQNAAYPAGTIGRGAAEDVAASNALRNAGIPGIRYLDQGSRFSTNEFDLNALKEQLARSRSNPNAAGLFPPHELEAQIAKLEAQPKPTSNYVLFRDDIVDILKKWGLIGGMAGAGAAASGGNDQAQAAPFGSLSPKP